MNHRIALCLVPLLAFVSEAGAADPEVVPLWPNGAPGFESRREEPERAQDYWVANIHNPSITAYLPPADKATGAAVVICPGGGHSKLVITAEGSEAAEFLNGLGVAAFVLKYRLEREPGSPYKIVEHAKADAYRAIRLVRSRADPWHVDPQRVGILGFSAGGEVVSLVAYDAAEGDPQSADPIERHAGRPDFQVLIYPGPIGIPQTVPRDAPPAFFVVANDDRGHVEPIIDLVNKYRAARAPFEVHIFARGGHAFNMGKRSELRSLKNWPDRLADWMADNDILQRP